MNIAEIILDLHINSLHSIKTVANKNNITSNQLVLLYAIPFTGVRQTDLSHKLCIDISTLSRNLDKLIHLGLVSKTHNNLDKHQCTVCIAVKANDG